MIVEYQHLDEIIVLPSGALQLTYSEPDQGGTLLLYRLTIPILTDEPFSLETGYSHEEHRDHSTMPGDALPDRARRDAVEWLTAQLPLTQDGSDMRMVLTRALAVLET